MNFGTLIALPLEMRCRHAIETLHAVKTMNSMYTTDANLKMYEKRHMNGRDVNGLKKKKRKSTTRQ